MNQPIVPQSPSLTEAKTLISTQDEAITMGVWDARKGQPCNPDAYVFAGENNVVPTHFRGDYLLAYVTAKGL